MEDDLKIKLKLKEEDDHVYYNSAPRKPDSVFGFSREKKIISIFRTFLMSQHNQLFC
jgi:hypothetical protein